MSRSGYIECDGDGEALANLYRGSVARALTGKRGQQALIDFIAALDAMPEKRLVKDSFRNDCGVCSLGALAEHRGVDVSDLDPYVDERDGYVGEVNTVEVGKRLDISKSMAADVMYENDEFVYSETEEERWSRMRRWAIRNLNADTNLCFATKSSALITTRTLPLTQQLGPNLGAPNYLRTKKEHTMTYNPKLGGYQPTANAVPPAPPPTEHSDSPPKRRTCEPCTCARIDLETELLQWADKLKEAIAANHRGMTSLAAFHIRRLSDELTADDWC